VGEYLTIEEVYKRFDSEWVVLIDPQTDKDLNVLGGEVLAHGKDHDEVFRLAMESGRPRPWHIASVYTGKRPEYIILGL